MEQILERAHQHVHELLSTKKPLLQQLAQALLEKEVLDGEELRRLIHNSNDTTEGRQETSGSQRLSA